MLTFYSSICLLINVLYIHVCVCVYTQYIYIYIYIHTLCMTYITKIACIFLYFNCITSINILIQKEGRSEIVMSYEEKISECPTALSPHTNK